MADYIEADYSIDSLDEKLRDRLRALQAREEELIDESGEQPMPASERVSAIERLRGTR